MQKVEVEWQQILIKLTNKKVAIKPKQTKQQIGEENVTTLKIQSLEENAWNKNNPQSKKKKQQLAKSLEVLAF